MNATGLIEGIANCGRLSSPVPATKVVVCFAAAATSDGAKQSAHLTDRVGRYLAGDLAISRAYRKLFRANSKSGLRRSASAQAAAASS